MNNNEVRAAFDHLRSLLRPWLGEVRPFNLPSHPEDICVSIYDIKGHGFSSLCWRNNPTDPDWIAPKWRTNSGVICPRCQTEIQALLKSHKSGYRTVTGAPYVFCKCIRLNPSRLPSLKFFTANWSIVLETASFLEQVALKLEQAHLTELRATNPVAERQFDRQPRRNADSGNGCRIHWRPYS
jgi:hypothetical protein